MVRRQGQGTPSSKATPAPSARSAIRLPSDKLWTSKSSQAAKTESVQNNTEVFSIMREGFSLESSLSSNTAWSSSAGTTSSEAWAFAFSEGKRASLIRIVSISKTRAVCASFWKITWIIWFAIREESKNEKVCSRSEED